MLPVVTGSGAGTQANYLDSLGCSSAVTAAPELGARALTNQGFTLSMTRMDGEATKTVE